MSAVDRAFLASRIQPSTLRLSKFPSIHPNRRLSFDEGLRPPVAGLVIVYIGLFGSFNSRGKPLLVFLTKVIGAEQAVRKIDSAFLNGDYVFALRDNDPRDPKIISRPVVRKSRSRVYVLAIAVISYGQANRCHRHYY